MNAVPAQADQIFRKHHTTVRVVGRWVAAVCMAVLLSACQTAYYAAMEKVGFEKRDILSNRVEDARDAQVQAKEEIVDALEAFSKTVNYQGGKLEAQYKSLKGHLEDSEDAAANVRKRVADVEKVGDALFREWRDELSKYTSADLKRRSTQQLVQTDADYKRLIAALKKAEGRLEPALSPLRDQVLFLKHNLNARALSSLRGEVSRVDTQVDRLIADINQAVAEADSFIKGLK
ncbi:MAG: DUF2959 domain-containing protein [Burkholderiaceae bacterium]